MLADARDTSFHRVLGAQLGAQLGVLGASDSFRTQSQMPYSSGLLPQMCGRLTRRSPVRLLSYKCASLSLCPAAPAACRESNTWGKQLGVALPRVRDAAATRAASTLIFCGLRVRMGACMGAWRIRGREPSKPRVRQPSPGLDLDGIRAASHVIRSTCLPRNAFPPCRAPAASAGHAACCGLPQASTRG
jgi:hypothetical protein